MEGSILKWVGVRLADGQILCDLEGVMPTAELPLTIGQYESVNLTLNVTSKTPPEWEQATLEDEGALVAYLDLPGSSPVIMWGGIVTQRIRTKSTQVRLATTTPEVYFTACYVGPYGQAVTKNQDTILSDLVINYAAGANQIPWVLNHLTPSTVNQTVTYLTGSNVTVYKALQDLSAISGGPEWFCDWVWNTSAGTILPRINYGARVGTPAPAIGPYVTITPDDCLDFQYSEDGTSGNFATQVTAYGTAIGASGQAPSATANVPLNGRPEWQYVFNVTTTSDPNVLQQTANAAAARIGNGVNTVTASLPLDAPGMQFGNDWFLGDDLGYLIPANGLQYPTTISAVPRVKGVRIGLDRVTPIFWS